MGHKCPPNSKESDLVSRPTIRWNPAATNFFEISYSLFLTETRIWCYGNTRLRYLHADKAAPPRGGFSRS